MKLHCAVFAARPPSTGNIPDGAGAPHWTFTTPTLCGPRSGT